MLWVVVLWIGLSSWVLADRFREQFDIKIIKTYSTGSFAQLAKRHE